MIFKEWALIIMDINKTLNFIQKNFYKINLLKKEFENDQKHVFLHVEQSHNLLKKPTVYIKL